MITKGARRKSRIQMAKSSALKEKTLLKSKMDLNWRKKVVNFTNNPYPTAFPYGNGMVLHFYQQQESSTTKTVHKVINKRLKTYV